MKKIIIIILIIISLQLPNKAHAQFVDWANLAQNTLQFISTYWTQIKESSLDPLAYQVSRKIGEKMSNKVFNKANGGASGDDGPNAYIDDFYSFFSNLDNSETDRFIRELEVSSNPFAKDIARGMVMSYSIAGGPVPDNLGGFDLDRVLGPRWQEFQNDASVGGWDGFLALSNPANTNIGSSMIARERLGRQIENAREIERLRLISPGTQPQTECNLDWKDYRDNINTIKVNKDTIKGSGSNISEVPVPQFDGPLINPDGSLNKPIATPEPENLNTQIKNLEAEIKKIDDRISEINKRVNSPDFMSGAIVTFKPGEVGYGQAMAKYDAWVKESASLSAEKKNLENKKTTLNKQLAEVRSGKSTVQIGSSAAGIAMSEDYARCLKEIITNPMGLVQDGLEAASGAVMERLTQADSIGEILGGMLTQMLTSFIQNGIASLSADYANRNNSNSGSINSSVGGPEQLVSADGKPIPWTQAPSTVIDLPNEFSPAIKNTQKEIDNLTTYVNMVTQGDGTSPSLVNSGARLDQCLPGPDFRWSTKMQNYYERKIRVFEKTKGNEKKQDNRAKAEEIVERSFVIAQSETTNATIDPMQNIPGATIMQSQLQKMISAKVSYRQKRDLILSKQSVMGILLKIETDLLISMRDVRFVEPTIPSNIVFTEAGWDRLSPVEKTTLQNWAKTVNSNLVFGTDTEKNRDQVIQVVWNIWTNPESYITNTIAWSSPDPANPQLSRADSFLIKKNEIRSEFNSAADRITTPRGLDESLLDVSDMRNTIVTTKNLADDCEVMRTLIVNNRSAGTHERMLEILKSNIDRFKNESIKIALSNPSILIKPIPATPTGITCNPRLENQSRPLDFISPLTPDPYSMNCVQNAGIGQLDGDGTGGEISNEGDNDYQQQPPSSVWELIKQDQSGLLYCRFNLFLKEYGRRNTDVANSGDMICIEGIDDWYRSSETNLLTYFYNKTLGE